MRTSNPVLSRQFKNPYAGQHSGGGGPRGGGQAQERPMTYDDVIVKSIMALALVIAAAAVSWLFIPPQFFIIAWALSGIVTLVITIVACVRHVIPAPLVLLFALAEGVFVGGFSRMFEGQYQGIVLQAVLGTIVAAAVTLFAYKFFDIKVGHRFRKIVLLSTVSFGILALVNMIVSFFTSGGLGLRDGGPLAILFSAVGVVLGVMNLVLDFDFVEKGVQARVPASQAWRAALGIVLTLVWLYLELLRLLSYFRR